MYVFYRSHLVSPDPPVVTTALPHRKSPSPLLVSVYHMLFPSLLGGELQQHLQLLKLKPAPSLFKKQVALAEVSISASALIHSPIVMTSKFPNLCVSGLSQCQY